MFAVEVIEQELLDAMPHFKSRLKWFLEKRPDLAALVSRWHEPGSKSRRLLSLARAFRMKKILQRMLDENEFLSPYGIRAMSRYHLEHPYVLDTHGTHYEVRLRSGGFDLAHLRRQLQLARAGLDAGELPDRRKSAPLLRLLWRRLQGRMSHRVGQVSDIVGGGGGARPPPDEACACATKMGNGPSLGDNAKMQTDPNFRDYLQFYEYFNGDNGRGLGANHQTGWTGLIANLISEHGQARILNPTG